MHPEATVAKRNNSFSILSVTMSFVEFSLRFANVAQEFLVLAIKVLYIIVSDITRKILPKSKKDLRGEIVLITGSAHGLGRQLALDTAELGAKVVLWDINEKVKDVAEEIRKKGGKAWWYICDVTSEKDIESKAESISSDVGDVTILINNAGIMQNVPLLELDSEKIKRTFNVNILAHFWTIRAFLPKMKENNYGHIVAIASAAGLIGHVNQSDYSASKYAVVGMMESLSEEMRLRNCDVKFTTICPLTVNTGLNQNPVARYPLLTPILSIEEASRQTLNAVRTEEFLVTLPRRAVFFLLLFKFLPRKITCEAMDMLEYCRVSNDVPNGIENEAR